jgi:hypothetical protein
VIAELTSNSLLVNGEQTELFDASQLPEGIQLLQPENSQRRRFTAEIVARNQERYREIVSALAEGMSVRRVSKLFRVSHHVVRIIREREPELVATEKKRLSGLMGHAIRESVESYLEDLERGTVPVNVKLVGAGILCDKKAMIDGDATSRIEVIRTGLPSLEEMKRVIEALPSSAVSSPSDSQSEPEPGETPDESGQPAELVPPVVPIQSEEPAVRPAEPATVRTTGEGGGGGLIVEELEPLTEIRQRNL